MIALFAAMEFEARQLTGRLTPAGTLPGRFPLYRGRLAGRRVELVLTGPGKANAAAAAASYLASSAANACLLFGCGGAYAGSGLQIGDLALAESEILLDEGSDSPDGFLDLRQLGLPLLPEEPPLFNRIPLDDRLFRFGRERLRPFAAKTGRAFAGGPFVTVSTCTGTDRQGETRARASDGICENMEGGALALTARRYRIPLLELRGISNLAGRRERQNWDLPKAMEIAQQAVLHLLETWPGDDDD
ncbi:futalosine hydrolase [Geothermobacter ehrlichii]|uniref:Futalosine hydrolase n=1 Tax=Geothermobacter ehrlichii TaxID=213224 RepID=A0A5D3WLY1_9BACT|nr:futalosine hydrolase [Geothermobacter ehrlichii]TYO99203.1 futalosine hydrolase [Geothermobacter ehrlichii]